MPLHQKGVPMDDDKKKNPVIFKKKILVGCGF